MPRVVPTQIVMLMEDRFAAIVGVAQNVTAPMFHPWMRGIVTLIDRLPSELLPVKPSDFAELIFSVEVLRTVSEEAVARNFGSLERNAFREIHRILKACPDAAPAPDTADPAFIDDPDLRADLHRDLGEVNHALSNGEWKAATVLAGYLLLKHSCFGRFKTDEPKRRSSDRQLQGSGEKSTCGVGHLKHGI